MNIQSYSKGHFDCIVKYEEKSWRFTGFYGNPVAPLRKVSWQFLRRLAGIYELKFIPWIVGGDFYEILFESEKVGGGS